MSTSHVGYVVILEPDIPEDAAIQALNAIRRIRGVLDVREVTEGPSYTIAKERAHRKYELAINKAMLDVRNDGDGRLF